MLFYLHSTLCVYTVFKEVEVCEEGGILMAKSDRTKEKFADALKQVLDPSNRIRRKALKPRNRK